MTTIKQENQINQKEKHFLSVRNLPVKTLVSGICNTEIMNTKKNVSEMFGVQHIT